MIKSPTPSNDSDKENQAPKKKYSKMVNADSTVISSDEDIPLAKINLKSPGKSPKKNGNLSNGKSDFSKISNNKKSVSSSDDDAPLSVLKPKLKNMKKKQPTLFDLANKNKGKFKLVEKTSTKNSSESRSKSPRNLKTAAPRHHKLITEAIKIWKKHEKAVQLNKTNEQQRIKKALYMLISKIVRELNTNKQKHHIENCRNQVIKDLINQKIAKVNYENLTPEEKKKIRDEKRKKQEEERRNEKLAAENLMVDDCLLDCDPEKKLNYKGLKLISSSPKFYEKYINLPKEYVHLFPDILTTYQFLKGHASYLSITGMTTRDFKKHFTLKNWIVSIKDKVQTQNKLFMRICLCLIRTKLSKKITNIPVFEEYNIDLSDVCMRKHLNKDLFCFIVYNYLEFRYQENFQAEESYKERKAKEKIENDSKRGEDSDNEDDDGGQSEVSSVSNAEDLEDEMLENESAKYKTILDTLSAFNNDFDLLGLGFCYSEFFIYFLLYYKPVYNKNIQKRQEKKMPEKAGFYLTLTDNRKVYLEKYGNNPNTKILFLTGGPGADHNYLNNSIDFLAKDFEVYLYDQLGTGKSDKLNPEVDYSVERAIREVENVRKLLKLDKHNFILYGHSWGGILAASYACSEFGKPNLKGLIISNMMMSCPLYNKYIDNVVAKKMYPEIVEEIRKLEAEKKYDTQRYTELLDDYYNPYFVLRLPLSKWPDDVVKCFEATNLDYYLKMQGPSEFGIIKEAKLANWDVFENGLMEKHFDFPQGVLFIGAQHDTMDPKHMEECSRRVQKSGFKSSYHFVPGAGHMAMWGPSDKTYYQGITDFLK